MSAKLLSIFLLLTITVSATAAYADESTSGKGLAKGASSKSCSQCSQKKSIRPLKRLGQNICHKVMHQKVDLGEGADTN